MRKNTVSDTQGDYMYNVDDFVDDSSMNINAAASTDPSKTGQSSNTPVERIPMQEKKWDLL